MKAAEGVAPEMIPPTQTDTYENYAKMASLLTVLVAAGYGRGTVVPRLRLASYGRPGIGRTLPKAGLPDLSTDSAVTNAGRRAL